MIAVIRAADAMEKLYARHDSCGDSDFESMEAFDAARAALEDAP